MSPERLEGEVEGEGEDEDRREMEDHPGNYMIRGKKIYKYIYNNHHHGSMGCRE